MPGTVTLANRNRCDGLHVPAESRLADDYSVGHLDDAISCAGPVKGTARLLSSNTAADSTFQFST